ncbi:MAG: sugar O-acetyltransferase [Oscillospiraceae bacterium]|nr:sugar O-acetyltransferase [Oscillospiraceae bacterium]MBR7009796.1 sugar O-acetyltransferase [Oscillospiraceae bacterium]
MTEREKMLRGMLYDPSDGELAALRLKAHRLWQEYNALDELAPRRTEILDELVPNRGPDVFLAGPIYIDYGVFTSFGARCYANFNFTVLDTCPVTIGDDVMFGPNCSLLTPLHPLLPRQRNLRRRPDGSLYDLEYGAPITVESDCWIASNVKILGGVTIGRGSVVGAGSVVTHSIPAGVLAAGNPCRVIRPLTEEDLLENPCYLGESML